MTDFNGRTILVTGASGGIGAATVRQLTAAGAQASLAPARSSHWPRSALTQAPSPSRST